MKYTLKIQYCPRIKILKIQHFTKKIIPNMQMKKFNNKIEIYLELSEITEMLKEWKKYTIKTSSKLLQTRKNRKHKLEAMDF